MRPPHVAPAIAFSPARLLGAAVLLGIVVLVALLVAARRSQTADAANAPLKRLKGFHIFGPDDEDDDELPVHVPVLQGRPAGRIPPPPSAPGYRTARSNGESSLGVPRERALPRERPVPLDQPVPWERPAAKERPALREKPAPREAREVEVRGRRAPANAPAAAAPTPPTKRRAAAPPKPKPVRGEDLPLDGDILLVEDDVSIASMYQLLLGARGYTSRHAVDGVEGIAMVRQERPALILLDMMMPRMDGLEFLEAIRGWPKTREIPVVVLSNVTDRDLVDRALDLGAVEYLVKAQTRPQVLIGALPHWLRGNRALTTLS